MRFDVASLFDRGVEAREFSDSREILAAVKVFRLLIQYRLSICRILVEATCRRGTRLVSCCVVGCICIAAAPRADSRDPNRRELSETFGGAVLIGVGHCRISRADAAGEQMYAGLNDDGTAALWQSFWFACNSSRD